MNATAAAFESNDRVGFVRAFNRFYTNRLGLLRGGFLDTRWSLTEVRVLFELAHRKSVTAREISAELGVDAGYLSRILKAFEYDGLLEKGSASDDARRKILRLTKKGAKEFAELEARQRGEIESMLSPLGASEQTRLVAAMAEIQDLLGRSNSSAEPYVLRPHRPGDMGWVVHRHGALYAQEYGYNERFEALVSRIVADFLDNFDSLRERCWIAERRGEIVGSIFLVKKTQKVAKLRMLLVEPSARKLGIGGRLIEECVSFAHLAGYKKIVLWTQRELVQARRLYMRHGFKLTGEKAHSDFGEPSVAETWELVL